MMMMITRRKKWTMMMMMMTVDIYCQSTSKCQQKKHPRRRNGGVAIQNWSAKQNVTLLRKRQTKYPLLSVCLFHSCFFVAILRNQSQKSREGGESVEVETNPPLTTDNCPASKTRITLINDCPSPLNFFRAAIIEVVFNHVYVLPLRPISQPQAEYCASRKQGHSKKKER